MSSSKSKSSSNSNTVTETTTQQYDQRVAGTDQSIVIGAGAGGDISVTTLPDGLDEFATLFLNAVSEAGAQSFSLAQAAIANSNQAVSNQQATQEKYGKYIMIGLGVVVFIAIVRGKS